jgi:hypothetical protein
MLGEAFLQDGNPSEPKYLLVRGSMSQSVPGWRKFSKD